MREENDSVDVRETSKTVNSDDAVAENGGIGLENGAGRVNGGTGSTINANNESSGVVDATDLDHDIDNAEDSAEPAMQIATTTTLN